MGLGEAFKFVTKDNADEELTNHAAAAIVAHPSTSINAREKGILREDGLDLLMAQVLEREWAGRFRY